MLRLDKLDGVPRRDVLWAPGTRDEIKSYPKSIRRTLGRGLEVAQWGVTDTHAKQMKGALREAYEVLADGVNTTYRLVYYPTKDQDGPVAERNCYTEADCRSHHGATQTHQRDGT